LFPEAHIRKKGGSWGFMHENIYYLTFNMLGFNALASKSEFSPF